MKRNFKLTILIGIICIMGFSQFIYSQSIYRISNSYENDMKLSGTSTLHDWDMDAKTFTSEAQFFFKPDNQTQITSLQYLTFTLLVQNLKSDESGLDKNAYKALKTDKYKNIIYRLVSSAVVPVKDNKFLIKTTGNLSIAGVTKEITMNVLCVVNKDATITCTGSVKLKMTDFQVERPSFMFGTMTTGDIITLDFTLVYKK